MTDKISPRQNEIPGSNLQVVLYRTVYEEKPLRLIHLNLKEHISFMHSWANQYYTTKYWQMEGDFIQFYNHYEAKLKEGKEIILIAYLEKIPVAQLEVYPVKGSVLNQYIKSGDANLGFHLLMAPYRELLVKLGSKAKGISKAVLQCTLEYLFYNAKAENVMAEPAKENKSACILAEKAGFTFQQELKLPDKTAALYRYKRDDFLKKHPMPVQNNKYHLFADRFKK